MYYERDLILKHHQTAVNNKLYFDLFYLRFAFTEYHKVSKIASI